MLYASRQLLLHYRNIILYKSIYYITSCGAMHNQPRPLLPPSEWWLVNAELWPVITKNLTFDPPTRLPELTQNWIRSSHGHCTPSLKISCKSVQPFSRNLADKETNKGNNIIFIIIIIIIIFSHPRSEAWPHHERVVSICVCLLFSSPARSVHCTTLTTINGYRPH